MPAITARLRGQESTILAASQEIIIINGTLTNSSISDVYSSLFVVKSGQRYTLVSEMLLPAESYPPIVRRPESVCTKMILGAGDAIIGMAWPKDITDFWQNSLSATEISNNWFQTLSVGNDEQAVLNLSYVSME